MSSCCPPKSETPEHEKHDSHRQTVRDAYAKVATANNKCILYAAPLNYLQT